MSRTLRALRAPVFRRGPRHPNPPTLPGPHHLSERPPRPNAAFPRSSGPQPSDRFGGPCASPMGRVSAAPLRKGRRDSKRPDSALKRALDGSQRPRARVYPSKNSPLFSGRRGWHPSRYLFFLKGWGGPSQPGPFSTTKPRATACLDAARFAPRNNGCGWAARAEGRRLKDPFRLWGLPGRPLPPSSLLNPRRG